MIAITHILCPIDFSEISRHALDSAVAIARQHHSAVTALHVVPPIQAVYSAIGGGAYVPYVYTVDDLREFQKTTEQFVANVGYPVRAIAVEAVVVDEIVQRAAQLPADLIVIGTHGRSGFDRLFLGSVTERVLAKAPCPVLTIPPRSPEVVAATPLFRKLLCPIDFSPSSLAALTYAEGLSREPGTTLTVLHVVERLPAFQLVPAMATGAPDDPLVVLKESRDRLHRAIPQGVRRAATVNEVVSEGNAGDEILKVADVADSDLIVMGAHAGHAGLLGFGSTTNRVVRRATCPVLTLKA
jgi:nucleotide-binding universal stress UspA family protein